VSDYGSLLTEHYAATWGEGFEKVRWTRGPVHELPAGFTVLRFAPSGRRAAWVYATCSMSAPESSNRVELHLRASRAAEELVELLTIVAHFHVTGSALGLHHTVNFGRPWLPGSACDHGLVSLPYPDGPSLEHARIDSVDVRCLWLMPITKAERELKMLHGAERLEQRFDETEGFDPTDPNRASVA
jgi:hypothetical protein